MGSIGMEVGCGIYRDGAGLQRWVVGSIGVVLGSRGGLWDL